MRVSIDSEDLCALLDIAEAKVVAGTTTLVLTSEELRVLKLWMSCFHLVFGSENSPTPTYFEETMVWDLIQRVEELQ